VKSIQKFVAVMVFLACFPLLAWGQGGATGAISGTVQDASGAVIASAKVVIVNEATGETARDTVTDSAGEFTATLLPVGSYSVQVSATGFASTKFAGVLVNITETTRMTAVLKVSAVSEKVEVSADIETINTSAPTTGESLVNTTITTLPLATRNFEQLLALSAGASSNLNSASQLGRGFVAINVNGGRDDNNNYLIEGITASDFAFGELTFTPLPNPDAVDEFKVSTSLYDASQGRNGGGNINAILKGGTATYHGDAWEYFRNTVLDANDWFLKAAGEARPVIKQNIFGGDFGGQVDPNDKKWGFFYANYQGTRQRSGASLGTFINTKIPVLPPLAQRTGPAGEANLESLFNVPNIDPVAFNLLTATGTQFGSAPGGPLIPSVPGTPGLTNGAINTGPLILSEPGQFTDDQFTGTWDDEFNGGKDRVAFRFFWSDSSTFEPFGADSFQIQTGGQPTPNNLNFPLTIPLHSRFGSVTETHLFGPNVVNEFRFGVNIIGDKLLNDPVVTATQLGINRPTSSPSNQSIYRFQFGSYAIGAFPNTPQNVVGDTLVWSDTVSVTHGPHTVRFGGEADHTSLRRDLAIASDGLIFFAGPQAPTDFQGFLEGSPFFGEAGGGLPTHNYKIPAAAGFAQDDYRVTHSLTLNLGLRLEFVGAPYDDQCHIGNVIPQLVETTGQPFVYPTCVNAFKIPGLVGTQNRSTLANNYTHVWEPRIGFAYDLFGHHTTSIRGGYGIYSVREDIGALDNLALSAPIFPIGVNFLPGPNSLANLFQGFIPAIGQLNPAFTPTPTFFAGFPAGCTLGNGAMSTVPQQCGAAFTGNIPGFIQLDVPQNWIAATTQQWNLTVQRELGRNWFAEIGYVGTKGTHLRATYDPDEATKATPASPVTINGFTCAGAKQAGASCVITDSTAENAPARAPFLGIAPANFEAFAPISDSHYNALQATVAHRFSKGLYFQSAYTFSKSIDDVSTASVAFDTRFNDQLNARDSRGLSDFDRRHRSVTSFVYELPFFSQATGFRRAALGGWETSGVLTLQSGAPMTPFDSLGGSAFAFSSPNLATPVFAPGFSCANASSPGGTEARIGHWLNPAAFASDPTIPLSNGAVGDATDVGNVPRNCFIGPPQANMDLTIGKSFRLTERQTLRFRTDFFNLTNHPSFQNPSALDIEAPSSFSQLTSLAGTPRLIQFSLKYSF
jgi:Carboxypeptidase regulatory-like domain